MAQLAKIETAKLPATALAGVATGYEAQVIPLKTDDTAYRRLGLWVLVLVLGVFMAWAGLAPLGSYAVATGTVVVQAKKQVIQHREGGVIEDIFVADGDRVQRGQKLLLISPTDAKAEEGIVQEQLLANLGLESRLNAELEGRADIAFPAELLNSKHARVQSVIQDEAQQFRVNRTAANTENTVLQQRIERLQEQLQGTVDQVDAQATLASSYAKELEELRGLYQRQLISKLQITELERKHLAVKAAIAELASGQDELRVQISEAKEQQVLQANKRQQDTAVQLREVRVKIADLRNRLSSASDRLERTVVTAPMTGTVVGLAYHTKGGVVQPAGIILEIVPDASGFEVDAQVSVSDIDKVHVGQSADIRFPAFPALSFLKVTPGEVTYVSADTLVDPARNMPYYRAKVMIKPEGVAELTKHQLGLVQGMPAEVSIKAGERTFLDYLLKPISNMVNHAFNED